MLKNLEIIEYEDLVERVKTDTGLYFDQILKEHIAGHGLISAVQSIRLIGAIEIVKDKVTKECCSPVGGDDVRPCGHQRYDYARDRRTR